ncbi:MAG: aminoacyl-tRNA hydrolase [Clostridia bacterium]|nr:aminoacyl-tRNA hydrolase [Clostridia bacterium]
MFLIVGLGNPDKIYQNTYHNIGFMVVDKLCQKGGFKFSKSACKASVCEFFLNDQKVMVAKPKTYMNLSGNSVMSFKNKYKLKNENILVVVDDIDLPLGSFRFKSSGSGGTHNGMRSIVRTIGSDFPRIRIGIGKPKDNQDLANYVLSKIDEKTHEILEKVIDEVVEIILDKVEEANV